MHLRHLIIASAFVVASGIPGPASAQLEGAAALVPNTDRPGGDYRNFNLNGGADACRDTCSREAQQCRAWTFVKAGIQGPSARCWLKNVVPPVRANPCCTSGVNPQLVVKVCQWRGTAPFCNGDCPAGWSKEWNASDDFHAQNVPAPGAGNFGQSCVTGTKALCCRFQ
jgi:hypothetical protein